MRDRLLAVQGVDHLPHDPATGKRRASGAAGLKASQVHPAGYGIALRKVCEKKLPRAGGWAEVDPGTEIPLGLWSSRSSKCRWAELHLQDLAAVTCVPRDFIL